MKKITGLFLAGLLCCLCGCSAEEQKPSEIENVFQNMEGSTEEGYSVKNLEWGMAEEAVREATGEESLEADGDRLIATSESGDVQYAEIYIFADETRQNLVTVEYTWNSQEKDSFSSVSDALYQYAADAMEETDAGSKLTEEMMETGATWTGSDGSMVQILSSGQSAISVRLHAPRQAPATLG